MVPESPGSSTSTSACTPRAMRVHAPQRPQASTPSAKVSRRSQLSACASAIAAVRLPTPAGPEKIRLGGSVPRPVARASSSNSGRWPVMSRKGIASDANLSLPRAVAAAAGLLVLLVLVLVVPPAAEDLAPEALLFRLLVGFGVGLRLHGAAGDRRRGRRVFCLSCPFPCPPPRPRGSCARTPFSSPAGRLSGGPPPPQPRR